MSNLRQIGSVTQLHLKDHNSKYPNRLDRKDFEFAWLRQKGKHQRFWNRHPKTRSLNPYVLGMAAKDIPKDIKIPIAQCPSDPKYIEERGASYNSNTKRIRGLKNIRPLERKVPGEFKKGKPVKETVGISLSQIENPSRFITFSEKDADKTYYKWNVDLNSIVFYHTPKGKYYWNVLFADTSVNFVHITPSLKVGEKYSFDRREK